MYSSNDFISAITSESFTKFISPQYKDSKSAFDLTYRVLSKSSSDLLISAQMLPMACEVFRYISDCFVQKSLLNSSADLLFWSAEKLYTEIINPVAVRIKPISGP